MTRLHKIYLGIVAVLVLAVGVAAYLYTVASVRAEEKQKAAEQIIAAKDQAIKDRDKIFQTFKEQVLAQISDLKTAKQAVTVLQPIVQPAGQAPPQSVTKGELPSDVQKTLPGDASSHYTLFSDEQMVLLGKRELACQVTEAGLTKCDADKADMQSKIDGLTKANKEWAKVGAVPQWTALIGATKDAVGKGYSPTLLLNYRLTRSFGVFGGVQGKGDLTAGVSVNFGGASK